MDALLEARTTQLEQQLSCVARESVACQTLLSLPGVGLLTATAMVAATGGNVAHVKSARHFASWFGLTPMEHSSGQKRHLGRISKRGDRDLRMLLTRGARSILRAALPSLSAAADRGSRVAAAAHGGVERRSTRTNAQLHLRRKCVVNPDARRFHPSVTHRSVYALLVRKPGIGRDAASLVTRLVTVDGQPNSDSRVATSSSDRSPSS